MGDETSWHSLIQEEMSRSTDNCDPQGRFFVELLLSSIFSFPEIQMLTIQIKRGKLKIYEREYVYFLF